MRFLLRFQVVDAALVALPETNVTQETLFNVGLHTETLALFSYYPTINKTLKSMLPK